MLEYFAKAGKASFIVGGQFGSEAKGSAAAFLAVNAGFGDVADFPFEIATCNAGAQAGHTSIHNGVKKVVFHLPTYSLYRPSFTYLNAGSVIDTQVLCQELEDNPGILRNGFALHPNCAIITDDCRAAEMRDDSPQTRIASTRKGVGEALARKVLRSGFIADNNPYMPKMLQQYVRRIDLNAEMLTGKSVLVEVPQGHSLSIDGPFYPHTTSRNCTVGQAMSDAGIHPHFYHRSMLVVRTFPIRVGGITRPLQLFAGAATSGKGYNMADDPEGRVEQIGYSGDCFPDQHEISWADLGVAPEITTVTKRVRRVFTFSEQQVAESIASTRPNVIFISFMDYLPNKELAKTVVAK